MRPSGCAQLCRAGTRMRKGGDASTALGLNLALGEAKSRSTQSGPPAMGTKPSSLSRPHSEKRATCSDPQSSQSTSRVTRRDGINRQNARQCCASTGRTRPTKGQWRWHSSSTPGASAAMLAFFFQSAMQDRTQHEPFNYNDDCEQKRHIKTKQNANTQIYVSTSGRSISSSYERIRLQSPMSSKAGVKSSVKA